MMSVVRATSRHVLADQGDAVEVALAPVGAAHGLQHAGGAGLQRQVDVLAERRQLGVGTDDVLAHVLRDADSCSGCARALDAVEPAEELAKRKRSVRGSSRPYELTFCPSSVISRTPSATSRSASARSSPAGRDTSRPRVDGTMQYEQAELQPTEICIHAWNCGHACRAGGP
jgi:ribosomal protein L34E